MGEGKDKDRDAANGVASGDARLPEDRALRAMWRGALCDARLPEDRALRAMWRGALGDAIKQADAELASSLEAMSGARCEEPWDSADYAAYAEMVERDAATVTRLLSYRRDDRIMVPVATSVAMRGDVVDQRSLASAVHACARMHVMGDESESERSYCQYAMLAARFAASVAAESDPGSFKARRGTGSRTT